MKRILIAGLIAATLGFSVGAHATNSQQVGYCSCGKPHEKAQRYMSPAGYHRWLVFRETGVWPTGEVDAPTSSAAPAPAKMNQ